MLKDRLKVAIPLILVVFLAFFLPGIWGKCAFAVLAAAILVTSNHEGIVLTGLKPFGPQEWIVQIFGLSLIANAWAGHGFYTDALLLAFVLLSFVSVFNKEVTAKSLETVAKTILVGVLVSLCLSYIVEIFYNAGENSLGPMILAYMVAVTKVADIGAYAIGTLTAKKMPGGNHKLAIHVSPKKSWEGLVGGILFSVVTSLLFWKLSDTLSLTCVKAIILGVLAATVGLLGDLAESLLKRAAGAKDSGKIPGLGGALDVMDSLIPMGIIFYAWFF